MEETGAEETYYQAEEGKEDLEQLCEQQRQRIEILERELREKDKELQVFRKLPTSPPSDPKPKPKHFFDPFPLPKLPYPAPNVSGSEFWDIHLENSEGNDYSFEDIAAKGLWILTSGTERKSVVSTLPRKMIESQRTIAMTKQADPASPFFSPKQQNFPGPDRDKGRSPPQSVPIQLPQLREPPGKGRKPYASASPLQPRTIQPHSDSNRVREPEYPASQGYLRSSFKKEERPLKNISPGRRNPPKERPVPPPRITKGASVGPSNRNVKELTLKPGKGVSSSPIRSKKEPEMQSLKSKKPPPPQLNPIKYAEPSPEKGYSKQYRSRGKR